METFVKERLSFNFINSLSISENVDLTVPKDWGTDCFARFGEYRIEPSGKRRFYDNGQQLHIQLKATTDAGISIQHNTIAYPLKVKNYNDLIMRRKRQSVNPLILILFILPNTKAEWVQINEDNIKISKYAYWYYPHKDEELTNNVSKKTVYIPLENKLNIDCFSDIYSSIDNGE